MRSEISIWINAPPERVFGLVADLSRWKERLPHYRYVRVLGEANGWTRAAMSARRGWFPVFWHAVQSAEADLRRVSVPPRARHHPRHGGALDAGA